MKFLIVPRLNNRTRNQLVMKYNISDVFERFRMYVRPVELNPWPGNDSLDVKRLHDALLDYDHDYNTDYCKSTDLRKYEKPVQSSW